MNNNLMAKSERELQKTLQAWLNMEANMKATLYNFGVTFSPSVLNDFRESTRPLRIELERRDRLVLK